MPSFVSDKSFSDFDVELGGAEEESDEEDKKLLPPPSPIRAKSAAERLRVEEEKIRMRDCRNMVNLLDAVRRGRLQATLACQRAGYFGGDGVLAQLGFAAYGSGILATFVAVLVAIGVGAIDFEIRVLWNAGGFCAMPIAITSICRGVFLYRLKKHTTTNFKRALNSVGSMKIEERLGFSAQLSLSLMMLSVGALMIWFGMYYAASGGQLDLSPILPPQKKPFVIFATILLLTCSVFLPLSVWYIQVGRMRKAQVFFYLMYVYGGLGCIIAALLVSGGPVPQLWLFVCGVGCLIFFAVLKFMLVYRRRNAMTPQLQSDIARYDEAWGKVLADPLQRRGVEALDALVSGLEMSRGVPAIAMMEDGGGGRGRALKQGPRLRGGLDLTARGTREQLTIMLAQAWALNGPFQDLCAGWRGRSNPCGTGNEENEKGLLPKRRARAIEKVFRTYEGDATRLRDLVRCSFVFETADELRHCLEIVLADERCSVRQIKNRFAVGYDARVESCGYRDVQLKITLREGVLGKEEREMGLHEHVCELQLHLRCIYELKNDQGHKRYVEYRNRMAE